MSKKINWRVYVRDHIYPQSVSVYVDAMHKKNIRTLPYYARFYEVMSFVGSNFWWARDLDPMEKRFRLWVKRWVKDPKHLQSYQSKFQTSLRKCRQKTPRMKEKLTVTSTLGNADLFRMYDEARSLVWENIKLSEYPVDLFDDFFDKILIEQFGSRAFESITIHDQLSLMKPAYASVVMQYKLAINKLSLQKNITIPQVSKLAERFCWMVMSWDGGHELTETKVRADTQKASRRSRVARLQENKKIVSYQSDVLRERKRILRDYRLPSKTLEPYFTLLDIFTALHDDRKECQMRTNQVLFRTLRHIARRFRISYNDMLYYMSDEIQNLCLHDSHVSKKIIAERKKGFTIVTKKNRSVAYTGSRAYRAVKQLVLDPLKTKERNSVKGIPACAGAVSGKALVVTSAKEAKTKIKKGMVLITSMTTVDYVPAMEKAAAIVTDDGGITSHAAIVSRELKVPCVVGTKIATQVFKTGDIIAVEASNGIVKKV